MTAITGAFRESTTSGATHTFTVPSGVTSNMRCLIAVGSGSSSAVTMALSAGGASFTKVDERNATNTRVAIFTGTGLVAGSTVTLTLTGGTATVSIQHHYQDEYTYGTLSAAVRGASSADCVSGSVSASSGQKILLVSVERTTAGPTTVSGAVSSGGETVSQIVYNEGATVQTSVYLGQFTASATASRTATVTYNSSSTNGFAALILTSANSGGGGGGPTGGTPAAILNLGVANGKNHFNLGVGYESGHVDKTLDDLEAGFVDSPYFYVNAAGNAVVMAAPLDGGTTSANTQYARVEFRELDEGGDGSSGHPKASWNPSSGTHYVKARIKIINLPPVKPQVCIMQMHDADDDTAMILTQLISGTIKLVARINGSQVGVLMTSIAEGAEVVVMIKLINGVLGFYLNDMVTPKITSTTFEDSDKGQYFKTGCYAQSNEGIDDVSDGPFIIEMRELEHWHTGDTLPTTPTTVPTVAAGGDASVVVNSVFARVATDTDNGSVISARQWRIVSGPTGSNIVIDSDASLAFTPTVVGSYTLRYQATNATGTGSDDMILTVTATQVDPPPTGEVVHLAQYPDGTSYSEQAFSDGTTVVNVANSAALTAALNAATAGQKIRLADATYSGAFTLSGRAGTKASGILIESVGTGANFASGSTFTVKDCAYVHVKGINFPFDTAGDVFQFRGSSHHSRLSRATFGPASHTESSAVSNYIYVGDTCRFIRIDHNEVRNKGTSGNGVRVYGSFDTYNGCQYVRIDHNIFRSIKPEVGNDKEPIRYGVSTMSRTDAYGVIERNFFTDCLCEPELTSVKMGSIRVTGNTYYRCAGGPVIRHGTGSIMSDNYIVDGNNTTATTISSGGPRFYDAGHRIEHNYIFGTIGSTTFQPALLLDTGDAEGSSTALANHWRVISAVVNRNVLINTSTPIQIGDNYSTAPLNCTITNNITAGVTGSGTKPIDQKIAPVNATISNNVDYATAAAGGFVADVDGIFRKTGFGPRITYIKQADVGPAGDTGDTDITGVTGTGGGTGTTAPVVNVGSDTTALVGSVFTRTASESGSSITARTWAIVAGPTGVGTQIGNSVTLTWAPQIVGEYQIRYTATNAAGSSSDDIIVSVSTGGGPVVTPFFGGIGTANTGASADVALPPPSGVLPGDFQIAVIADAGPEDITTVPLNWRLLDSAVVTSPSSPVDRGGPSVSFVYYNTTGDNATATWQKSGTRFWHGVRAYWRGQTALGAHGVTIEASGAGSTSHVTPSVTPARANSRVIGIVITDLLNLAAGPFSPPAGWTERYDVTKVAQTENESIVIADFGPDGEGEGTTPPPVDPGGGGFTAKYYVSTTGNNSNNGLSPATAVLTINKGFDLADPGDTISVADGTYTADVTPSAGGSSSGYVTLRAANKHQAKIVGALTMDKQYVEIRDMDISGTAVQFACDITANNVRIIGNRIHDIHNFAPDSNGGSAVEVYSADGNYTAMSNILIEGNLIFKIGTAAGANTLVQGIYPSVPITNGRIQNNIIFAVADFGIHSYHNPSGWIIVNNTVVGCGRGILADTNSKVRNNISYNNLSSNYDIRGSGNSVSNNISGGTGNTTGTGITAGTNPLFVNSSPTTSGDFHLQTSSPALNAGTTTDAPSTDYSGVARPQGTAVDLGAYEAAVSGGAGTGTLVGWGGNDGLNVAGVTNEIRGIFMARSSWADLQNGNYITDAPGYTAFVSASPNAAALIGVPLIPHDQGASSGWNALLDEATSGARDSVYTALGAKLATTGPKTVYARVWWEFNVEDDNLINPTKFKAAWARAIPRIRSGFAAAAPTKTLKIVLCSMPDRNTKESLYPGSAYVDIVSYDVYGKTYGNITVSKAQALTQIQGYLNDLTAWGTSVGKPIALDEWGNWMSRPNDGVTDHRGYNDWPEYITAVFDWANLNNAAYLCYFNEPGGGLGITLADTPNARAIFVARAQALQA